MQTPNSQAANKDAIYIVCRGLEPVASYVVWEHDFLASQFFDAVSFRVCCFWVDARISPFSTIEIGYDLFDMHCAVMIVNQFFDDSDTKLNRQCVGLFGSHSHIYIEMSQLTLALFFVKVR